MTTRSARLALVLCGAFLMSACVRMPSDGPVTEVRADPTGTSTAGVSFDPKPPQAGESETEIVRGFLEAMQATPPDLSVALKFLTSDAQLRWTPERSIITYSELGAPASEVEAKVAVQMTGLEEYDARGAWQRSRALTTQQFSLKQEGGQWRIDELPDALVVPDTWFGDWYRRVSLYFFDPTAQILVPEPVFVPEGNQLASAMVRGLLDDPTDDPRITRTFVPPGFKSGLSVPVTPDGIADVSLVGEPSVVDDAARKLIVAQLKWTLRQEQRIRAVRLAIGEDEQGQFAEVPEDKLYDDNDFDPTGARASGDLFGLLDGRVVRGSIGSLADGATSGAMGTERLGVRSIGVNLAGDRVAGVSGHGQAVLVAPVDGDGGAKEVASGARNLLPPAWDFADRIWLADRTRGGAVISYVIGQRPPRAIEVPGVTGRDVRHLLVSRDGSRLVAVVRGPQGDRVVASRILHNGEGRVLRAEPAVALDFAHDASSQVIRDIGWRSPTSVSVLTGITDDLQVETISVDGSPGELFPGGSSRLRGAVRELVSSPVANADVFVLGDKTVSDILAPERPLGALPEGISSLTYVG